MRLPASVLGSLRLGLGATALIAAGCDAAAAPEAPPHAAPAEQAPVTPALIPDAVADLTLADEVVELVEEAVADTGASPVVVLAREVTAHVPFSDDPSLAEPIRPRPEPRSRPRIRTRPEAPPKARPQATPWEPPTRAEGWSCPACGRG
ncbi:MAG: hypothetical protein AAGA54_23485 [Myxococcota bacterium]